MDKIEMQAAKKVALVAHDNMKDDLLAWCREHDAELRRHTLFATGTTGALLSRELGLAITALRSGPLGGDQQIGAKIAEGDIDFLIFFFDPLAAQPHDPDVKALLRLAAVWNIPHAMNRATADFVITSPLMASTYTREVVDVENYRVRMK